MAVTEMIVAAGAAVVAVINGGFLLASQRKQNKTNSALTGQVRVITNEVKNSHPTNLRDDMDKHYTLLVRVAERVDKTSDDVREVRRETGRLFDLDRQKDNRLHKIERHLDRHMPSKEPLKDPPND